MSEREGRGRLMAFRIVAVIFGLLGTAPAVFLVVSVTSTSERLHVIHNTAAFLLFFGVIALGWVLAAVAPERMIAPAQAAVLGSVAVAVAAALAADVQGGLIPVVVGVVLVLLHPARPLLTRLGRTAPAPLILAAVAAMPVAAFAWSNAALQRDGLPTDPHVEMHHWTGLAAFGLAMIGVAVVSGIGGRNRRVVAIVGGLAAIVFGVMSKIYPGYPGAVSTPWAIACIIWGLALAGDGYRMARETSNGLVTANMETT